MQDTLKQQSQEIELLKQIHSSRTTEQDLCITEDEENDSIMDIVNQRFAILENKISKLEKKNAKQVTIINKLLKASPN